MSAFSRGCLLGKISFRTSLFFPKSSPLPRHFTTTILRAAQKQKPRPPLPLKKSPVVPNNKSRNPSLASAKASVPSTTYKSYTTTLSQKGHITVLFTAPSHTGFLIGCYSAAAFCFTYAGIAYYTNAYNRPPGLAKWVPIAFTGISIMMVGFGGWLILGPANIIRTISAIPKSIPVVGKPAGNDELIIEIVLRKMFPVWPARKIYCKPSELKLPSALCPPPNRVFKPEELRAMRLEEELRLKQELEYEKSHILSSPFRHMNRAFFNLFKSLGRVWTRDGFMKVEVNGRMYKLDLKGWALEGGKALDRLSTIKPRI